MLLYSHIWDGLLKLISLAGLIIAAASVNLEQRVHSLPLMIGIVGVVWAFLYRQYLSILSSWLYARGSLHTNVTFSEARALRKLFQLDLSGKWLPLRDIKKLPNDQRHDVLLAALDKLGTDRKAMLL